MISVHVGMPALAAGSVVAIVASLVPLPVKPLC
jgi:hypothetical protein